MKDNSSRRLVNIGRLSASMIYLLNFNSRIGCSQFDRCFSVYALRLRADLVSCCNPRIYIINGEMLYLNFLLEIQVL